jgi:predicted O-methyltransferase YrrM
MIDVSQLRIPLDYWRINRSFETATPWITPHSIVRLCSFIGPETRVLEFGSGGSTLFWGTHCGRVLTFETKASWASDVSNRAQELGLTNIMVVCDSAAAIELAATTLGGEWDLIVVDSNPGNQRARLLILLLPLLAPRGILCLDNYSRTLPQIPDSVLRGVRIERFNDTHWHGTGTALLFTAK